MLQSPGGGWKDLMNCGVIDLREDSEGQRLERSFRDWVGVLETEKELRRLRRSFGNCSAETPERL